MKIAKNVLMSAAAMALMAARMPDSPAARAHVERESRTG